MCGILGGTNSNWSFTRAVEVLSHRGPDASGIVHNDGLALGFARLAIIDLSRAADQPMSTEDKMIWIVFNGEIYGFKRLRDDLIGRGCKFKTQSDTEVILHAYREWGDGFVDHIDGMFAIAIHDLKERKLKLFRDRPGIKPLYYFFDGRQYAFSSELKGITALCHDVNFDYDYTALYDYLTYHYIPEPKTLYRHVFKLPPAHQLTFDLAQHKIVSLKPYWRIKNVCSADRITSQEACDQLRDLIGESVRDQLVADVPLGCFLSGGMDSSVIAAEAAALSPGLETFSIGFEDKNYTENHYAQIVAQKFKINHNVKILSNIKTDELYRKLKDWYDEPFADTSAFPTFLVSEYAREKMTVVLTGDGGDEVFGGYTRFNVFKHVSKIPRFPNHGIKKFVSSLRANVLTETYLYKLLCLIDVMASDQVTSYGVIMEEMPYARKLHYARKWGIPKDYDDYWYYRKYYRSDLPVRTRIQYLDFHTYLPSDILVKVDRTSMAVSLEARVPFLSRKIIEFMFSLPEELRFYNGKLKGLLKETYKNILPQEILNRKKMGFGIPFKYFNQNYANIQETILKEIFQIE